MSNQSSVELPTQAPRGFQFEEPRARIDWYRIREADPSSIRSSSDAHRLKRYVGEVAMGRLDSEGGPTVEDERERRAFRLLQFQLQYLLYSHQALQQRAEEAEQKQLKMLRHEAKAKRVARERRDRVRSLAAEATTQEQVLQSYLTLLEGDDPDLAQRITWNEHGDLAIEPPPPAPAVDEPTTAAEDFLEPGTVQLLEWDQPRGLE